MDAKEGNYKFSVSKDSGSSFYVAPPIYICPVHGEIEGNVTLWKNGKSEGEYCMTCYKEMIRKFCQPVTALQQERAKGGL